MTETPATTTPPDGQGALRTYFVHLWFHVLDRSCFLRIDAIDAWDANAICQLIYQDARVADLEAWNERTHGPRLTEYLAKCYERTMRENAERAALTASAPVADQRRCDQLPALPGRDEAHAQRLTPAADDARRLDVSGRDTDCRVISGAGGRA